MLRDIDLKEISDGRFYGLNDMVKADCGGFEGCSACCRGMGSSILLDPLDAARLSIGTDKTFEGMVNEEIELTMTDGVILPALRLSGEEESCPFLNEKGRCSIHAYRPGICRIFPLGRYYEEDSFRYFLQVHECVRKARYKIKVKQWIDTPFPARYDRYVCDWHFFIKALGEKMPEFGEKEQSQASMYVLKLFYSKSYGISPEGDFYTDFYDRFYPRLDEARDVLEIG